ncbi:MAG: hypothetical protein OHK0022_08880 [Roseiflexaceae bacterium]
MSDAQQNTKKYLVTPLGVLGAPVLTLELTFSPSPEAPVGTVTGTGTISNPSIEHDPKLVGPLQVQGSFIFIFSPSSIAGQYIHLQSGTTLPGAGSIQAHLVLNNPNGGGQGSFSYFDDRSVHQFAQAQVTLES